MKKVGRITNTWKKALKLIKQNQINDAVDTLDRCLVILTKATEDGIDMLDNVSVDLWKVRVWVKLEDLGVIPGIDEKV